MDYKARFYSPYINRFLQPDSIIPNPSDPRSWNRYSYVGNNPINNNDPDGRCWPLCTMVIGAAIGAVASMATYAVVSTVTGKEITKGGLAGAAVSGAIAGAVSGIAGPIAGTALKVAGMAVTATSLSIGTAVVNGIAGAGGYVAGTTVTNAIDVPDGNKPIPITASGIATSAAFAGILSPIVNKLAPVNSGQYSWAQAKYFAPGRTWGTLFSTEGAQNIQKQIIMANGAGTVLSLVAENSSQTPQENKPRYNGLGNNNSSYSNNLRDKIILKKELFFE